MNQSSDSQPPARPLAKRGLTLAEVVLAVSIVAVLLLGSFYMLVGSVRHAKKASDLLSETIIAQVATRQVREAVSLNPKYLEALQSRFGFTRVFESGADRYVSFGTVMKLDRPIDTPLGSLTQSGVFSAALDLGRANGTAPNAPVVKAALASATAGLTNEEFEHVLASMGSFAAKVTVSDAARPMEFLNESYNAGPLRELMKEVMVEVYWLPGAGERVWEPVYRATDQVLTPVESLSPAAAQELYRAFESWNLSEVLREILVQLKMKGTFDRYDAKALDVVSRIFLIYREANLESFITQGKLLVTGAAPGSPVTSLDDQIATLARLSAPYFRKRLGGVYAQKAILILDTYRRMRMAVEELEVLQKELQKELQPATSTLASLLNRSRVDARGLRSPGTEGHFWSLVYDAAGLQQDYKAFLESTQPLILRGLLIEYLFSDPKLVAAFDRLKGYPARFREALTQAGKQYEGLALDKRATWLTQTAAVGRWIEVSTAQNLVEGTAPASQASFLGLVGQRWQDRLPLLAAYVQDADVQHPLAELGARHVGFLDTLGSFKRLGNPDSPMDQVRAAYVEGGILTEFLTDTAKVGNNLVVCVESTGVGAGTLMLPVSDLKKALEIVTSSLSDCLNAAIRYGLTSIMEIQKGIIPSRTGRVTRLGGRQSPVPADGGTAAGDRRPGDDGGPKPGLMPPSVGDAGVGVDSRSEGGRGKGKGKGNDKGKDGDRGEKRGKDDDQDRGKPGGDDPDDASGGGSGGGPSDGKEPRDSSGNDPKDPTSVTPFPGRVPAAGGK